MKILSALFLIIALTGCWDDAKSKKSSEFMSNLTKCRDDCKITKPFLGGDPDGP